tara:strand:- start:188 stop:481 length:294 start_codon:yes stop_codon:yes gene_type:complete
VLPLLSAVAAVCFESARSESFTNPSETLVSDVVYYGIPTKIKATNRVWSLCQVSDPFRYKEKNNAGNRQQLETGTANLFIAQIEAKYAQRHHLTLTG